MKHAQFEAALLEAKSIPFKAAADFFIGIRAQREELAKTAGLSDAPDETGLLEGHFAVSPEVMASLLTNVLHKTLACAQASLLYRSSVRGDGYGIPSDWEYNSLAEEVAQRIAVLAGPAQPPPAPVDIVATTDRVIALKSLIRGTQEIVQALNEARKACGENPLGHTLAQRAAGMQSTIFDLWKRLDPASGRSAPSAELLAAPLAQHEAVETPEVAASESPELEAAEQEAGAEAAPAKTASVDVNAIFAAAMRKLANEEAALDATMSAPSDKNQLEPTNYLSAELLARRAQEQNESAYYRQKAQDAFRAAQAAQEQLAAQQAQLEQAQMQASETGSQIQQIQQEAMAAQDEALRQSQVAANMRMGMQKLRAQMLEVASQDPAAVAAQELQNQAAMADQADAEAQMAAGGGAEGVAPAEGAPAEDAAPPAEAKAASAKGVLSGIGSVGKRVGSRAGELVTGSKAKKLHHYANESIQDSARLHSKAKTLPDWMEGKAKRLSQEAGHSQRQGWKLRAAAGTEDAKVLATRAGLAYGGLHGAKRALGKDKKKTASLAQALPVLGGVAAGAGLGALHARGLGRQVPERQAEVAELEGQAPSFGQAMRLTAAKARLSHAELADQYPQQAMLRNTLLGGVAGGIALPGAIKAIMSALK